MKKFFLFLALVCSMAVSAQNSVVITYTVNGVTKTLRNGTHNLPNNRGTITINGIDITFDHVELTTDFGMQFIPSDMEASYRLMIDFVGYNDIGVLSKTNPAMDFMGNPSQIYMDGDVLRIFASDAATIHASNGYIRSDIMELYARNWSKDHYTIEMGAGKKLDISLGAASYRRVELVNHSASDKALALSPEKYDLTLYDWSYSNLTDKVYATPNSQEELDDVYSLEVGGISLNKGNLPYVSNFVPGLKNGEVSIEKAVNGYYNINLKNVEIATGYPLFFGENVNFRVNVEGDNQIVFADNYLIKTLSATNRMRGHVQFAGVGNNAKLDATYTGEYGQMVVCQGLVSFENLSAKFVGDDICFKSLFQNNHTYGDSEQIDDDYHQFIVKTNANVILKQTAYDLSVDWSGLIAGFTNLGSGSNVYANPSNGVFVNCYAPFGTFKTQADDEYPASYIVFGTPEGIDETTETVKATKTLRNGQLLIFRDGKTYNAQGIVME